LLSVGVNEPEIVLVVNWLPLTVRLKFLKVPAMLLPFKSAVAAFSFLDGKRTVMIFEPDTIAATYV
jgi:hypothetical protein